MSRFARFALVVLTPIFLLGLLCLAQCVRCFERERQLWGPVCLDLTDSTWAFLFTSDPAQFLRLPVHSSERFPHLSP